VTPSPTVTVIPGNLYFPYEETGTSKIVVVPGLVCAVETFETYPVNWVVVWFDGSVDYADPVEITNSKCLVAPVIEDIDTGKDIMNKLNREYGGNYVESILNP